MGEGGHGLDLRLPERFHGTRPGQAIVESADQLVARPIVDLPQRGHDGGRARVEECPLEPHELIASG